MNEEEPGRRKEEHIKYIPGAFRKLLFLNWFTNENKHYIVSEKEDIFILHNSLRPLILLPKGKKKRFLFRIVAEGNSKQEQQAACLLHIYVPRRKKKNICFHLPSNPGAKYNIHALLSREKAVKTISDYGFLLFSGPYL